MNSIKEKVMEFKEAKELKAQYSMPTTPLKPLTTAKNFMVGFDDELIKLMERLTAEQPCLQIIPIVGMGGIGKTTLANTVYENLVIVQHFDIRAWATISQEYSVVDIISEISSCLGGLDCEMDDQEREDQIGVRLYRSLLGRRYLIVLDDMWSIETWDQIKIFFPNNDNRSRIVVTSRISNVAVHLSSSSLEMSFLDEENSWKMFCRKVFLEEGCPYELEEIGKKIVRDCKGLPLSIAVIGGILRNSTRTLEYWEGVARDTNSIWISGNDEHCLNILSLSYNHLSAHIKPCLLYMGVLLGGFKIRASGIVKLFVAEGFVKPNGDQSLEEVAEGCLEDLVDRILVLVVSWMWNGRIKNWKMHDLVRKFCLRIGEKSNFFYVMRKNGNNNPPPDIDRQRRLVSYGRFQPPDMATGALPSLTCIRTFISNIVCCGRFQPPGLATGGFPSLACTRTFISNGGPLPFKSQLLKVLPKINFESVEAILQQVNLRYVYCKLGSLKPEELPPKLPQSLFLLWNLQTVIMDEIPCLMDAPSEILHMRQLRHVRFYKLVFPDPPPTNQDDIILPNLDTLSRVVNFSFTKETCKRIPNLKTLGIGYHDSSRECQQQSYCLNNLHHLHNLHLLSCSFLKVPKRSDLHPSLVFSGSLRKLMLSHCNLHWEDLKTYGFSLPHLEVFELYKRAIIGPKWDSVDGAFPRLRVLKISRSNLIQWTAEYSNFPVLEKLDLQHLKKLKEIPSGIGELDALRYLHLAHCSESATISSTAILEEQLSLGNDNLEVEVRFMGKDKEERFSSKYFQEYSQEPANAFREAILHALGQQ